MRALEVQTVNMHISPIVSRHFIDILRFNTVYYIFSFVFSDDNVDIYNNRVKICKNEQCNDENCRNYHISKARPTSKSNTENDSSGDVAPMPESTASASTGGN